MVIQSLWIGDRLSAIEQLVCTSFIHHGHDFRLYCYGSVAGIPDGVQVCDAREVLPEESIFKYTDHDSYAGFSNLFRYKLLYESGHYWVDMDVVCLRPFPEFEDQIFATEWVTGKYGGDDSSFAATCAVMAAVAGSPVMKHCYEQSMARNPKTLRWGETGPRQVQQAIRHFGIEHCLMAPGDFCPVGDEDWWRLISGSPLNRVRLEHVLRRSRSFGVHLYHEMWRRGGVDKDARLPLLSLVRGLQRKYNCVI